MIAYKTETTIKSRTVLINEKRAEKNGGSKKNTKINNKSRDSGLGGTTNISLTRRFAENEAIIPGKIAYFRKLSTGHLTRFM